MTRPAAPPPSPPAPPPGLLDRTERAIRLIGLGAALILIPLMILVRVTEIATRPWNLAGSLFNAMEGELFLILAFLTIGAAYVADAHVRVDVLADRFSARTRAWVELIGLAVFVLPFAVIVLQHGAIRAALSFEDGERMALTFGAATRWAMFACVPLGVGLFTLAALCRGARALRVLRGGRAGRDA
jgi:TRAP-type mannitol/chloroaromatic compound transport system permease small subunit